MWAPTSTNADEGRHSRGSSSMAQASWQIVPPRSGLVRIVSQSSRSWRPRNNDCPQGVPRRFCLSRSRSNAQPPASAALQPSIGVAADLRIKLQQRSRAGCRRSPFAKLAQSDGRCASNQDRSAETKRKAPMPPRGGGAPERQKVGWESAGTPDPLSPRPKWPTSVTAVVARTTVLPATAGPSNSARGRRGQPSLQRAGRSDWDPAEGCPARKSAY